MTSEACSRSDCLKTRNSQALLNVDDTAQKTKESIVFSLLKEKKCTSGTFKIVPSISLQKVKEFLPHLKNANIKILEELTSDPSKRTKFDIENVDEDHGRYVEMDLAVYEETDSDCSTLSIDKKEEITTRLIDEADMKFPGGNVKSNLVQVLENDDREKC